MTIGPQEIEREINRDRLVIQAVFVVSNEAGGTMLSNFVFALLRNIRKVKTFASIYLCPHRSAP